MTTKRISITADDYGPHPFISRGILTAIKNNAIDSVGVLVNNYSGFHNGKAWKYDFEKELEVLVKAIGDKPIGIGLHLSISSGSPLVDSDFLLLERNQFQRMGSFDFGNLTKHLAAIKNELKAQIVRLKDALDKYNIEIDHISSHHSLVTLFPPYNKILMELLTEAKLKATVRNPLLLSKDKPLLKNIKRSKGKFAKKAYRKSKMRKKAQQRAKSIFIHNVKFVGKLISSIGDTYFKKEKAGYESIGYFVPNHFFDNFYGKANQTELMRVFRQFQWPVFGDSGEIVVHLGQADEVHKDYDLIIKGIDLAYFGIRIKERKSLVGFAKNNSIARIKKLSNIERKPMFLLNPRNNNV